MIHVSRKSGERNDGENGEVSWCPRGLTWVGQIGLVSADDVSDVLRHGDCL